MSDKKTSQPDAEQLLKSLDLQLAESRGRREANAARRGTFRVVAIMIIVFGAAAALGILMFFLEDLRPETRMRAPATESSEESTR